MIFGLDKVEADQLLLLVISDRSHMGDDLSPRNPRRDARERASEHAYVLAGAAVDAHTHSKTCTCTFHFIALQPRSKAGFTFFHFWRALREFMFSAPAPDPPGLSLDSGLVLESEQDGKEKKEFRI